MISDVAAQASPPPVLAAITILGSGRVGPTASALLGLVGAIVGGLALHRARGGALAGNGAALDRWGGTAALVLGALGLVLGGLFLATADGGPGTGNGVVGSAAALLLGSLSIVLGGLARARRRDAHQFSPVQLASHGSDAARGQAHRTR